MDIRTLETKGFVTVPYPKPLRDAVVRAAESWVNFCAPPLEQKTKITKGEDRKVFDFGYMVQSDEGAHEDTKEVFHISRRDLEDFHKMANSIADKRAVAFGDAVEVFIQEMVSFVKDFTKAVESEYRLEGFSDEMLESTDRFVFRYLHYFGAETLAHQHTDRGEFTMHLFESHGGGEYLGFDKSWYPLPVSPEQTVIFPSMGLQYRSHCILKALCHRVVSTEETKHSGRYSIVAFFVSSGLKKFDNTKVRTRDLPEGFNYDMPFEAFSKLFI